MKAEDNPIVKKITNPLLRASEEIKKIDKELRECRNKISKEASTCEAKRVARCRIDELLDKRLAWMNDGIKIEKSGKTIKITKPSKNKKRILRLMRRRLK